ncbi:uncharacterized protein LOC122313842 [Carya illinoinensis]|uniref:Transmembrane protein n=1 Tax=Carya illinoinensis TaxID=32201 RepID=A0A8T1Q8G7_CARIL|nr:uncharacterized protein LOC122313842 [Carya illinoinensis]KAG6650718.1 hypothetical protein CIPAW_06G061400 [Carya illinoinensis]KAG6708065.1 hypothetical protein I3842_06G061000 [Carya illinoinensis]
MAKFQKKSHQTKPKTTHFLCCYFGCSSWASEQGSVESLRNDGKKINIHWLSWSRLIQTKKSGTKTAPLESTLNEKSDPKKEIPGSGSKPDKLTSMPQEAPVTDHKLPTQVPVLALVPLDQTHEALEGSQETTYERAAQKHVQHFERTDTCEEDMFQIWLSCGRKKEAIRPGYSHPGSPKTSKTKPLAVMSHSVSLPVSRHEKGAIPISSSLTNSRAVSKNLDREKGSISTKKLDSAVGLSIVVVTLIIMLVWGRVCAILSTSAWLYFVPRLVEQNPNSHHDQDYDSDEHKKKVVFEGFLERNHRGPP